MVYPAHHACKSLEPLCVPIAILTLLCTSQWFQCALPPAPTPPFRDADLCSRSYVPIKSDYADLTDVSAFFIGAPDGTGSHDSLAKKIAANGKKWAEEHWREADMCVAGHPSRILRSELTLWINSRAAYQFRLCTPLEYLRGILASWLTLRSSLQIWNTRASSRGRMRGLTTLCWTLKRPRR